MVSEADLADALERASTYVARRREETPKVVALAATAARSFREEGQKADNLGERSGEAGMREVECPSCY